MRAVKSLPQIQIVLNQLLNYQNNDSTKARNQKGNQIKNLGNGTDPGDAVTIAQISGLASQASVPSVALVNHFYTITWTLDTTPTAGQVVPPFCIVNDDRVGQPTALWLAAGTPGGGPMTINIQINGNNGNIPTTIFLTDLSLSASTNGPIQQSNFISPVPNFGLGTYIQPIITSVNGQAAVTFGLTVKKVRSVNLS